MYHFNRGLLINFRFRVVMSCKYSQADIDAIIGKRFEDLITLIEKNGKLSLGTSLRVAGQLLFRMRLMVNVTPGK